MQFSGSVTIILDSAFYKFPSCFIFFTYNNFFRIFNIVHIKVQIPVGPAPIINTVSSSLISEILAAQKPVASISPAKEPVHPKLFLEFYLSLGLQRELGHILLEHRLFGILKPIRRFYLCNY